MYGLELLPSGAGDPLAPAAESQLLADLTRDLLVASLAPVPSLQKRSPR